MRKIYDKPTVDIYSLNNADNTNALTQKSAIVPTTGGKVGVYNTNSWGQLK